MFFVKEKYLKPQTSLTALKGQVKKVFFLNGSLHIKVCGSLLLPPPPPISTNRAGFVATDKFKAPLFLYFSVLQGWRFKKSGAYTKSAFAGSSLS